MKKIFTLITFAVLCAANAMAQFDTWSVVGNHSIMNGTGDWAIAETQNDMSTTDGTNYTLTVTGKTLEAGTEYQYKYAKDHAWTTSVPKSGNLTLTVTETAVYDIVYNVNVETGVNSAVPTKTGDAGEITHTYSLAGAKELFGVAFDQTNTATDMTKGEGGIYTYTAQDLALAAKTYEFKVVEDHAWGVSYPSGNDNATLTISETASYDVTFTFNTETKEVNAKATKVGSADVEVKYYIKHPWGTGANTDWTVKELTDNGDGTYSVEALYGGTGCNWGDSESVSNWLGEPTLVGNPAVGDNCTFTLDPKVPTITITKKASAETTEFTISIVGCENGYVTIGETQYKDGDKFESATTAPAVKPAHVIGYTVVAPVIDAETKTITVTYTEVGTVTVTVKITNETGDELSLFAAEGVYWDNLNGVWPGTAFNENTTSVTMTKGEELHLIITNTAGDKQTANIDGGTPTEDTIITLNVCNAEEGAEKPYTVKQITTGISSATATTAPAAIYSISGQRLSKAQSGVNIINGKKIVVR